MRRARPERFDLDPRHPLSAGLLAAYLGGHGCRGSRLLADSSRWARHMDLIGYSGAGDTPKDRWLIDGELGTDALSFDAVNDYASITPGAALTAPDACSVSAWFNYTAATAAIQSIVYCTNATGSMVNYTVGLNATTPVVIIGWGNAVSYTGTVAPAANAWHHVCFSRGPNPWPWVAYVDGVAVASATSSGWNPGYTTVAGTLIGGRLYRDNWFNGRIGSVCIWDRAISPAEAAILADRSDPLHAGWLRPLPRRRFYRAAGFNPLWAAWQPTKVIA